MPLPDDIEWNPNPEVGDLVKCASWTLFPGQVGYVVHAAERKDVYGEQGPFKAMLYKVLVDGEIRDFLGWDVTVISD